MRTGNISDRVLHPIFGLGTVLGIHFDKRNNAVLEIKFDDLETIRCIMADFKEMKFI